MQGCDLRPLIVHFIYRLGTGGLENGLINIINRIPTERYRHAIVCLTYATEFRSRLKHRDVRIIELNEKTGIGLRTYWKLWGLLRELCPAIMHTRNIGTLEGQICAFLAQVPGRVHSEHGRDAGTVAGTPFRYALWRRIVHPFVQRYAAVSKYGATAITEVISSAAVVPIYNGVDTERFRPHEPSTSSPANWPFPPGLTVIGTVTRLERIKDPETLVRAFSVLLKSRPDLQSRVRLAIIGDGQLRRGIAEMVAAENLTDSVWLAGDRTDIPDLLRQFAVYVQPSITEGLSNTLLEAMATGLPTLATAVGGNTELLVPGCGTLAPAGDPKALADGLAFYLDNPLTAASHGQAARRRVEDSFSLDAMVANYIRLYDSLLAKSSPGNHSRLQPGK